MGDNFEELNRYVDGTAGLNPLVGWARDEIVRKNEEIMILTERIASLNAQIYELKNPTASKK